MKVYNAKREETGSYHATWDLEILASSKKVAEQIAKEGDNLSIIKAQKILSDYKCITVNVTNIEEQEDN